MSQAEFPYAGADLDAFRAAQRLAYECVLAVASSTEVGMTERQLAAQLHAAQQEAGVVQVLHDPFVWVGERTVPGEGWLRNEGDELWQEFFPTDEPVRDGAVVVCDVAPAVDGIVADVSYSWSVGHAPGFEELDDALAAVRAALVAGVREGRTQRSLYLEVERRATERGWILCNRRYPEEALGHAVVRLEPDPARPSPLPGFGTAAAEGLLLASLAAIETGSGHPVWNASTFADAPVAPGLWAVEPHFGRDGVGVKFEELLVVTEDDAFWLDHDVPHRRRWGARGH